MCAAPCTTDADCDDDDVCTVDECNGCYCPTKSRNCGEGFSCEPATGLCVDAEGADACRSPFGCDPETMTDYEATLHDESEFVCYEQNPYDLRVGGTCEDGTLFVITSDGLHSQVQYFEPGNGRFLAWIFGSDVFDCACLGVFYCPAFLECQNGVVVEVVCGTRYSVGDSIHMPERPNWYENELQELCAQ